MPLFQHHNRAAYFVAVPLECPVAVHTIIRDLGIGISKMMLDLVHPEAIAVVQADPARLKAYVDHHKLHRIFAKQVSNIVRR